MRNIGFHLWDFQAGSFTLDFYTSGNGAGFIENVKVHQRHHGLCSNALSFFDHAKNNKSNTALNEFHGLAMLPFTALVFHMMFSSASFSMDLSPCFTCSFAQGVVSQTSQLLSILFPIKVTCLQSIG